MNLLPPYIPDLTPGNFLWKDLEKELQDRNQLVPQTRFPPELYYLIIA
jgi:hypothetical protein